MRPKSVPGIALLSALGCMPEPPPWRNRDVWCYSIIDLPAKRHPYTHNAYAERVSASGDYTGRELGPFTSRGAAEDGVGRHRAEHAENQGNAIPAGRGRHKGGSSGLGSGPGGQRGE